MKTKETQNRSNTKYFRSFSMILTCLGLVIFFSSCDDDWYGSNGRPGNAFVSVAWEVAQPDYLDTGSPDIPAYFQWGRYYHANPGVYFLYYEGHIPNSYGYSVYAWEIEYSIWINQGEPGGYHHHGYDGPDNYFTLLCSPYGPYIDNYYKSGNSDQNITMENINEKEIKVTMKGKDFLFEAIYRKAEPRNCVENSIKSNQK